uniref:Mos1 transposase HTH domain-containing protein n=1 Tax=Parascaris univalens TaxID=6257 RepID=A0A915A3E4_PARUN
MMQILLSQTLCISYIKYFDFSYVVPVPQSYAICIDQENAHIQLRESETTLVVALRKRAKVFSPQRHLIPRSTLLLHRSLRSKMVETGSERTNALETSLSLLPSADCTGCWGSGFTHTPKRFAGTQKRSNVFGQDKLKEKEMQRNCWKKTPLYCRR